MRCRTRLIQALLLAVLLGPATANAAELVQVSIEEEGGRVIVELHGVQLATAARVVARGDRLDLALHAATGDFEVSVTDDTVKSIRVYAKERLRVRVQLRHSKRTTALIARLASVKSTATGLRIEFPRNPDSTLAPKPSPPAPVLDRDSVPVAGPAMAEKTAPLDIKEPTPQVVAEEESPAGLGKIGRAKPRKTGGGTGTGGASGTGSWLIFVLVFLSACGGLTFYMKRKRGFDGEVGASLQMVASKSLGPKTRVVWLSTGDRQLVVGLGPDGPTLLSEWTSVEGLKDGDNAPQLLETPFDEPEIDNEDQYHREIQPLFEDSTGPAFLRRPKASAPPPQKKSSPAVAGILSLRAKTSPVSEHVATESVSDDEEWARDLARASAAQPSVVR